MHHANPTDPPPRSGRRIIQGAAAASVCLLLSACWSPNQDKALDLIAAARSQAAKPALSADAALMERAQAWTDHLAATDALEHTGGGGKVSTAGIEDWCAVGENVARSSSTKAAHDALMDDGPHRQIILGNFDRVGTGVTRKGDQVWVTQIYVRSC